MEISKNNFYKKKWWVWFPGILVLIFLAATVLRLVYLEPWLQKKLETTVSDKSKGLYRLSVNKVEVSLLAGSVTLHSLSLKPNFKVWEKQKEQKEPGLAPIVVGLQSQRLKLQGLNFLKLLMQKPLRLNNIVVNQPHLVIFKMPVKPPPDQPLHQKLTGPLKDLRLGEVNITAGKFALKNYHDKFNTLGLELPRANIFDIQLDSLAYNDPKRFFYAQEVTVQATELNMLLPMQFYRLKIKNAGLSVKEGTMHLRQAQLVPLYTAVELSRKKGSALTQFKMAVPEVKLAGINFADFSRNQNIIINHIKIHKPRLSAYKDARNFEYKVAQPLPHQIFRDLKIIINIAKIQVQDLDIQYQEMSPKTDQLAKGSFQNMNLTVTNITNDKNRMSGKNPAVLKGNVLIMGKTPMQATIRYNLLSPNGYHTIQGTIGQGQPEILNPILEQDQLVRVESGTVKKGKFNIEFTESRAVGTMQLHYENFKIEMLSKPEKDEADKSLKQSLGKKILSKIANKAVLNTDNLPAEDAFKVGKINTPYRENRSVITFWIDGLTSGIRSSLGLKSTVPAK